MTKARHFATRAVRSGHEPDPVTGAHAPPVYQTSTFAYGSFRRGQRLFSGEEEGYLYGRIANPTTRAFERKLADLEGAEEAVAFSSGMAAVSALTLTFLRPGDELIFIGPLYGGTEGMFHDVLTPFGVRVTELASEQELEGALGERTRMVYLETPTNPTLKLIDLAEVARLTAGRDIMSVADNTFATPYLTRPLEHGFTFSLHSATKYLGGHGDAIGGVLAGPAALLAEVRSEGLRHVGGCLGPWESFLLLRGTKTLALRMEAHCAGAARVAEALRGHPAVARVFYPGLGEHPGHEVARKQMRHFGGMVSLELRGGVAAAERFLDGLTLFTQAVSLGDVESLATHPASTTHQLLDEGTRERQGITDGLVRLSVGIESPHDLCDDLLQSLDKLAEGVAV